MKNLTLKTETIRVLSSAELDGVGGAFAPVSAAVAATLVSSARQHPQPVTGQTVSSAGPGPNPVSSARPAPGPVSSAKPGWLSSILGR